MSRHFDSEETSRARIQTLEAALKYARFALSAYRVILVDPTEHSCCVAVTPVGQDRLDHLNLNSGIEGPLTLAQQGKGEDLKDAVVHVDAALAGRFDVVVESYK